ncbi:MAG: hypothetical protein FJY17_03070 [Bacteroidetes bacterium]|nr:hypothetical protein [Bacteroidota bacterium]
MSSKITADPERKIIAEFAKEVKEKAEAGSSPEFTVIDFRNDRHRGKAGERKVYFVPTDILRFRKDNGRIAADVTSYEKLNGGLIENSADTQQILQKFLSELDKENNEKLKHSIQHAGQIEPAIITCDGFLINGNRRKMVLEELFNQTKNRKYATMKCVILPAKDVTEFPYSEGGSPKIIEIEEIENRYQLQKDGKSEYTKFNWAVSTQRKILDGYSLERQLRDDSNYAHLPEKEFTKRVDEIKENFLYPLEAVDRYLESLDREQLYITIAEGSHDKDGRWYSFIDYYKYVYKKLKDEKSRTKLGVEEDEVGEIEDVCFKIIRKKDFKQLLKCHEVMRKIPSILTNRTAKKELMKIASGTSGLTQSEIDDCNGDFKLIDGRWGNKNEPLIYGKIKVAVQLVDHEKETENAVTLLEDSLKKLNHENMQPDTVDAFKIEEALKLCREIQKKAGELEVTFDHLRASFKKLFKKK